MNGKEVCKMLRNQRWTLKSINGSHHIYGKDGQKPVAMPVHGKKDLGKGLVAAIERQTGVKLI